MPFRKLLGVGTSTATLAESKSTHIVLTDERALRFSTEEHETNNGINRLIIIFAIIVFNDVFSVHYGRQSLHILIDLMISSYFFLLSLFTL